MSTNKIIPIQAVYYIITGLWPLIDINSFMLITGPKTDIWLVEMVGLLAAVIGLALLVSFIKKRKLLSAEINVLGIGSAFCFIYIDVYYSLKDIIANTYLIDAGVQIIFVLIWILMLSKRKIKEKEKR